MDWTDMHAAVSTFLDIQELVEVAHEENGLNHEDEIQILEMLNDVFNIPGVKKIKQECEDILNAEEGEILPDEDEEDDSEPEWDDEEEDD